MSRTIIHLDLDAFFCAVEENKNPTLRGRAFAVGGRPEQRGVVASCSYAARKFGIRSAMPMARALRLCPDLLIVPGRHKDYSEVSMQIMEVLRALTSLVEQISIDEAFLDVTELDKPGEELARALQARINKEFELPCSLGVATNKLVAKIATDFGKAKALAGYPPNAIQVVPPGEEEQFLAPLPANALWGVGPKTAMRLAELGIHKIGDIGRWPEEDLVQRFGKNGRDLAYRARGIDDRPVITSHAVKSVSQERTFAKDILQEEQLLETLAKLSARVSDQLQKKNLAGTTIKLKLRWSDFSTVTRQETIDASTNEAGVIYAVAKRLFEGLWVAGNPVRLLGVGVSGLGKPIRQLGLWEDRIEKQETNLDPPPTEPLSPEPLSSEQPPTERLSSQRMDRERRLESALESLRDRFGDQIVHWGEDSD